MRNLSGERSGLEGGTVVAFRRKERAAPAGHGLSHDLDHDFAPSPGSPPRGATSAA
ncbi:hypothetical protein [Methylobacterium aquaticum]|uniref:hypothetical protein n=1 Tax=Methylobacterium aquaticum TaxID=270351 RepID=UPI0019342511|nr:hypothetical protein [Methylobacterium aquaticum]